jgi:uncharacterized protein YjbI with pentapeptide repeats
VRRRAAATWEAAKPHTKRAWELCLEPRHPWPRLRRTWQWLKVRPQIAFPVAGIVIVLLLVRLWHWYSAEYKDNNGVIHHPHADILGPIATVAAAVGAAGAAVTAWKRHIAQTDADRERRLTESFSKAVEQLASNKMEECLGGIYTLEQISRESPDRYWPVMETLAAFVRERATWKETAPRVSERAYFLWQEAGRPAGRADEHWREAVKTTEPTTPRTGIAAVLTVICRRDEEHRERERQNGWWLNLNGTDLRRAVLIGAHLEDASFEQAHLEHAELRGAHFERTSFKQAHLEHAELSGAYFERAWVEEAHLERAELDGAHLEGAMLKKAHLEGAVLCEAHLQGAWLQFAHLEGANIRAAHFEGAMLLGARLERALVEEAHLEGARLGWARLEGAVLEGAHLQGADLDRTSWLHDTQVAELIANSAW